MNLSIRAFVFICALAGALSSCATMRLPEARYTDDGRVDLPRDYRTWVYLSSGLDMSYNPGAALSDHSMFDNVFVDPVAYAHFVQTGTWPEGAVFALEQRGASAGGQPGSSLAQRGHFQEGDVMGLELHVKDRTRFPGGWGFFAFDNSGPAKVLPESEPCYACHRDHAALDTTFVQFYPTLLPIGRDKHTLSAR